MVDEANSASLVGQHLAPGGNNRVADLIKLPWRSDLVESR
jgi:hypothetical protein